MAVAKGRLAHLVAINEKVALIKDVKESTERALAINSEDSGSWHILGMWHTGVANLNWVTRKALQAFMGMPEASNERAIESFDKANQCCTNATSTVEKAKARQIFFPIANQSFRPKTVGPMSRSFAGKVKKLFQFYARGQVLALCGQHAASRAALEEALRMNGDLPTHRAAQERCPAAAYPAAMRTLNTGGDGAEAIHWARHRLR